MITRRRLTALIGLTIALLTAAPADASMVVNSGFAAPIVRRQEKSAARTFTVTLNSTPTQGNLLLAFCMRSQTGLPAANTGWTAVTGGDHSRTGTQDPWTALFYKIAGAGESATQTPATGAAANQGVSIFEISGVTQASITSITYAATSASSGTPTCTASHAAGTTALCVAFACFTNNADLHAPSLTMGGSTWNNQASAYGGGLGSHPMQMIVGSNEASSGTMTDTGSLSFTGGPDSYGMVSCLVVF